MKNGAMPKVEKGVPLPEEAPMSRDAFLKALKPGESFIVTRKSLPSWQAQMSKSVGKGNWRMHNIAGKRTRFWRVA